MIGGRDIIIPVFHGINALDRAIRAVIRMWPCAVIEDGITGETFKSYGAINFAGRRELLAYRNADDARHEDPGHGTFIHLLANMNELTVGVDAEPSAQVALFVGELRQDLRRNRL